MDGDPIVGLENDGEAANYRGEGEPCVNVDVATTSWHNLTRLALFDDGGDVDSEVLLTADAARMLSARLTQAADRIEARA